MIRFRRDVSLCNYASYERLMTFGLNLVVLIGNAGADPDVRTTASGRRIATFPLATAHRRSGAGGGVPERTEWHRVVAWDALAEQAGRRVRKGERVFVEGSLDYRSWEDRSGRRHHVTEVVAAQLIPFGAAAAEAVEAEPFQPWAAWPPAAGAE